MFDLPEKMGLLKENILVESVKTTAQNGSRDSWWDGPLGDVSASAAFHSGTNDPSTQSITVPGGSVGSKQMGIVLLEMFSFARNR